MIELELTLDKMRERRTGRESIIVLSDDPRLQDIGTRITDDLETGPPILTDRGGLRSAIELLTSEGRDPLVLLWSVDMEEFGNDLGLEVKGKISYYDRKSVFGRPTLSLLSTHGPFWDSIPDKPSAVYEERYRNISEEYIEGLSLGGLHISGSSMRGDLTTSLRNGMVDLGIGVLSGEELLSLSGSWPLDRIHTCEPLLAGFPSSKKKE